jgi:hypothetical protein
LDFRLGFEIKIPMKPFAIFGPSKIKNRRTGRQNSAESVANGPGASRIPISPAQK